ncbi:MAG TPA: hypothetical protein PLJ27_00945 [Polyangiaceae bacterium]|nr:hypothetical protein [Polyangiaceae bacterium]HNZ22408.1 hypothetical protein [Polyangiaceae bacterium]HOD20943.1 hypothetical protein [Polyangiaceae bacterium]HOH00077.1 hypothetical protein [Polyangiaceae bacterium]HOR33728.1 hypothetical protein [Polyangiaceae bacterium]
MLYAFATFALVVVPGCKVYDESLLLDGASGFGAMPRGDGVGWWSGTDPTTKCATASMPRAEHRPKSDPGEPIPPLVFAVRSMRLGSLDRNGNLSPTAWQDIGFDLDGTCTRSPTCSTPEPIFSCKSPIPLVAGDGNFCRDNRFGELEYAISTNDDIGLRFGLNDHTFNCSLCVGAYNMLFKISDYNGKPNDATVRVDIYPSPGIETLKGIDCQTQKSWNADECWQKSDTWFVQSDYVNESVGQQVVGNSKLDDSTAYVRDGYVVARLRDNTRFWFPDDRGVATAFPLVVQGGVVTGKLVQDQEGNWTLTDGIIAGRMDTKDAIDSFRFIGLCPGDPLSSTVEGFAKAWADVLSSGAILPEVTCDALSVGIAFEASEATIGTAARVEVPDPCAGVDGGVGDAEPEGG